MFKNLLQDSAQVTDGERVRLVKSSNKTIKNREGQCFMLRGKFLGDNIVLSGFGRGGIFNTVWEADKSLNLGAIQKISDNGKVIIYETAQNTYMFERVSASEVFE